MLNDLLSRLRSLFRRKSVEHELDAEVRFHFDQHVAKYVAAGISRDEATRRARLEFGGLDQVKEECRDARGVHLVETLAQDIRYGLRMLRKSPGFTIVAILTLALGIGANTAIFSILESQLWRPLPFPDSEQLMEVHTVLKNNPKQWDVLSALEFRAWQTQSHSFTNLAAYSYPGFRNLTASGTSERVLVMPVASNFFDTLEASLARGRPFLTGEDTPGRDHIAIITDALWHDRLGADPNALGKPIIIDGESYTVVGIAPPSLRFEYIEEPAIFVPLTLDTSGPVTRNLYAIGRIAPGVTPERARTELRAILDREIKSEGRQSEDVAAVSNLREDWTHYAARHLYFFAGAVALVLLIACVNTSALLFARGLARQREFALRAALGAARGRLIRQLLVETGILALFGGVAGAFTGLWLARVLISSLPEDALPRQGPITLDVRVFLFALAISAASALAAGLLPAVFASRSDLNDSLRQSAPGRSASSSQRSMRSALVVIEIALGFVLLFGAGLFLSSFIRLQQAPRGFDAPGALTFRISLRGNNYSNPDQIQRYFDRLTENLRSLPGVRDLTMGNSLPLTGSEGWFANVKVRGQAPVHPHGLFVVLRSVRSNYFDALGMHLLAGRTIARNDVETSPRVAVINRNAAQELFGHADPLGKVLEFIPDAQRGVAAEEPVEIVGVVENSQEFGADEIPFDALYLPFSQRPYASQYVLISSQIPRGALAAEIRSVAYDLDKDQPVFDMKTMDDRISDSLSGARFNLLLVSALAGVAMLLVSVGTFGMVAYFVQQRTQEFGVRLALGATPATILRHAISQSLRIGAAGLLVGVVAALIIGRLLGQTLYLVPHEHTGMLYAVKMYDPVSMICACGLVIAVLLLASYIPARRAAKVDPLIALRYD